jgi:hypothetical protein
MDDRTSKVSAILHEAAETHHTVYRITEGEDDDWATWYSDWLVNLSELPDLLGVRPARSALTHALVGLDIDYREQGSDERWEDHYARRLIERFSPA